MIRFSTPPNRKFTYSFRPLAKICAARLNRSVGKRTLVLLIRQPPESHRRSVGDSTNVECLLVEDQGTSRRVVPCDTTLPPKRERHEVADVADIIVA